MTIVGDQTRALHRDSPTTFFGISQRTVENNRAAVIEKTAFAFATDPLCAPRRPRLRVRISRLTANAVRPVERIPLCRSGADQKSRPTWTGGQQRLFDSGG